MYVRRWTEQLKAVQPVWLLRAFESVYCPGQNLSTEAKKQFVFDHANAELQAFAGKTGFYSVIADSFYKESDYVTADLLNVR